MCVWILILLNLEEWRSGNSGMDCGDTPRPSQAIPQYTSLANSMPAIVARSVIASRNSDPPPVKIWQIQPWIHRIEQPTAITQTILKINVRNIYAKSNYRQVAQLSRRERAAGWINFGHKLKTIYSSDIISSTTVTLGLSACKAIEFGETMQH